MSKKRKQHKKTRPAFIKPVVKKPQDLNPAVQENTKIIKTVLSEKPAPQETEPTKTNLPKQILKYSPTKTAGDRLENYLLLMRIDKPIGILLLLWPTYWTLWLAASGFPSGKNLLIFAWGCILMRSAGCVINDYADRHFDGKVKRTKDRMIVSGKVSPREALILFFVLCAAAFALVCLTNTLTMQLSIGGLVLVACYPFAKRFTHLPQIVLGMAFAWSVPMAWTAQHKAETFSSVSLSSTLEHRIWLIYLAVVLWALVYDTFYAMVDREDDLKIGVKSTAILFGDADRVITGLLQALMIFTLILIGRKFELEMYYYGSLVIASALFIYQQVLIKDRNREKCFKAFLNNNYVGLAVFIGIVADFYF